jgi:1-acyl-sn-glycerol-3-phosphate acyltransferase
VDYCLFATGMSKEKFIDIKKLIASKNPRLAKWLPGFVINYLKRILHENEINDFLNTHENIKNADFCDEVIKFLEIKIEIIGIEKIPTEGPIIISMNHPFGGMDALALVSVLRGHREDLKFIVNDLLMNLTNLSELFVGVNKHGKNEVSKRQQIMEVFGSDEAVCLFPAGMVSRKTKGIVRDLEWKKTFITYAIKFDEPIVPIYIDGKLSNFFYRLANFRKFLGIKVNIEMLYLADELFKQRGRTVTFVVGDVIQAKDLDSTKSEKELAQMIKAKVYDLSDQKN